MSAAPPQRPPTPEELAQMMFRAQIDTLVLLVPGTSEEVAIKALETANMQEQQLVQVWQLIAEGPKKYWALRLSRLKGDGKPIVWHAPTRMTGHVTSEDINSWTLMLGVLTSPFVRAGLLVSGWLFEFAASDGPPSKIIM